MLLFGPFFYTSVDEKISTPRYRVLILMKHHLLSVIERKGMYIMKTVSKGIVRYRHLILIISLLLVIPAVFGYISTRVNYDILTYLPEEIDTMKGQEILKEEFGTGAFSMVVIDDMPFKDVSALKKEISKVDHVHNVIWYDSVADLSVPVEMLPQEVQDVFINGSDTMMVILYDTGISADETMTAVKEIRKLANDKVYIAGMSAIVTDTRDLAEKEAPVYVLLAVLLATLVLSLTMDSYLIPFIFLFCIGIAIIYNLGTNFFRGEISYITKALAAVLQLGVTLDYSIFLWHSFEEEQTRTDDRDEAMANAICHTFSSVVGSSVTTIAGFIALCFMSFTLGMDLGLVMAKGVIFGVISCVTLLPSMILAAYKFIDKTKHKPLLPNFSISRAVLRHYRVIVVIFAILWIPAIYGYSNTQTYYKLDSSLPENLPSIQANAKLDDEFAMGAMHIIIADADLSATDGSRMCKEIRQVDGVKAVLGLDSIMGPAFSRMMIPDDLLSDIKNDKYQMIMISSEYAVATDEINAQCDACEAIMKKYDPSAMLIGEAPCTRDLIKITNTDFATVSFVSIGVIFLIILLVFGSISIPVALIFVIEFAVFLNLAIPCFTGTVLPFIASIVISTVQLGSTVDYAILMTNRYKTCRIGGKSKEESILEAHDTSIRSVLVSAVSFFAATFGVGLYSDIDMISSLCNLMARGALISMATVILVLPSVLMVSDKVICATTRGMRGKVLKNEKARRNHKDTDHKADPAADHGAGSAADDAEAGLAKA